MEERKKRPLIIGVIILIVLLIVALAYVFFLRKPPTTPYKTNPPSTVVDTTPGVYEDDKVKIVYPTGWDKLVLNQPVTGVMLTKSNYTLVLVTNFKQAGTTTGGDFSDLSPVVSPWITQQGALECFKSLVNEERSVDDSIVLHNLYLNASMAPLESKAACGNPTVGGVLWYGAYFGKGSSYFLADTNGGQILAVVRYNVGSVNNLPYKGDADLKQVLDEASAIIKTMQLKTIPTTVDSENEGDK